MPIARCEPTGIHPELERWAREQGWDSYRPFQEEAAGLILRTKCDLIISASTSAGKTEAAYLPLLTQAARRSEGVSVLCLSPTKALINDQVRRIEGPAARISVPVYAWHGDAPQSGKHKLLRDGKGMVVMTIESLEGRFLRQPRMIEDLFSRLDAVVIDEFHEFLGGARGAQLGCLLARLDHCAKQPPRRIALSATIGDLAIAKKWICPQEPRSVKVVLGPGEPRVLRSRIRGYSRSDASSSASIKASLSHRPIVAIREIENSIFERLRGGAHIVFAGSRANVEDLCDGLSRRCTGARVQSTFVPHHGSMAKHARENVEERLRSGEQLTVISTTTLALGIDIGSIDSVELIGAPLSLTNFRQMVGRSGRRRTPATVNLHVTERPFASASKISDRLRLSTVRACAALNLLERRCFEPPVDDGTMLSVAVQQVLSILKQENGGNIQLLRQQVEAVAAFDFVTERRLRTLLEHLAAAEQGFLERVAEGRYILTEKGEKLVHAPEFYASFQASDQWDVVAVGAGKVGQISLSNPLSVGETFRLSGTAWEVRHLDRRHYRVVVVPASSGPVPAFDCALMAGVSEQLATEMREVLSSESVPGDLDAMAAGHLREGRTTFRSLGLDQQQLVADGDLCHLFSWRGTRFNALLAVLMRQNGFACSVTEAGVTIASSSRQAVALTLAQGWPGLEELSGHLGPTLVGKHDRKVPPDLLRQYWVHRHVPLEKQLVEFCSAFSA